jgi:hypothetical protein
MAVAVAGMSCQKPGEDRLFGAESLSDVSITNILVTCPPIPLSSPINTPTTLFSGNSYLLEEVVEVVGTTLTIQEGVVIFADPGSALVIQRSATLNAAGTASDPIIFTSNQPPGSRNPGDWIGLIWAGNAPNNHSNNLDIVIDNVTYTAGGNNASSNDGTLTYTQILYAGEGGGGGSDRRSESGLVLASLGSTTTIHHVEVAESEQDGVGIWGGEVFPREIIVHKAQRTDFMVSYGFQGNGQYLAGFKHNATANTTGVVSYAMDISNDLNTLSTSTPLTYPTFSNLTFLGGDFCNGDETFDDAIVYRLNGNGRIYNTVISSFSQYALVLNDIDAVNNTSGSPELQFSHNSFHDINNTPQYFSTVGWSGCGLDIQEWITGTAFEPCEEAGNQFSVVTLGITTNAVCVDCEDDPPGFPDFTLGTTTLDVPNYTWDSGSVFAHPAHRGAFGSTPWITSDWADFCPLNFDYCV